MSTSSTPATHGALSKADPRALMAALSAYAMWGLLPLFLHLFASLPALEVTAQRVVWTLPCALAAAALFGGLTSLRVGRRALMTLAVSAALIGGNWLLYVWAVAEARIVEASLGYFINPLVNVMLGVMLFKERLTRTQTVAIALAAFGVTLQALALGSLPWVAILLAGSFAAYGLVRKTVAARPAAGLFWETVWLFPLAMGVLVWLALAGGHPAMGGGGPMGLLLVLTGPATAIPLILFAAGARGLPFSVLGLLQYVAPTLQFTTGLALGEDFTPAHAASFGLIWAGLAVYSWGMLRAARAPVTPG